MLCAAGGLIARLAALPICKYATLIALGVTLVIPFSGSARPAAPALWLTIMEPVWRSIKGWPASDFGQLANDRDWSRVRSRLAVFEFTEKYAAHGDLAELSSIVQSLQSHGIAIAMQGVALLATRRCGLGVEGYGTATESAVAGERLQQAGARLRYIVFDEPLYYGVVFRGGKTAHGCLMTAGEALNEVLQRAALLRRIFPGVQIGDVEPFGLNDIEADRWDALFTNWLEDFRTKSGHGWDFVQADVVWERPQWWQQLLPALRSLRAAQVPWGVLYTGGGRPKTDAAWSSSVQASFILFERELGQTPPQAVVASWTDHPRRLFPETDRNSFLGCALAYLGFSGLAPLP